MTSDALSDEALNRFIASHSLPSSFRTMAREFYWPVAQWLQRRRGNAFFLLGISGAQGSGKSTLADFLAESARERFDWNVAVLSIDDFYLTRRERLELARTTHPLLATRGVPGTHDIDLMHRTFSGLAQLGTGDTLSLPRFDKSNDERAPESSWPAIEGPIDLAILEGWCVGIPPQDSDELETPINSLEAERDRDGRWRRFVNEALRRDYWPLFARLDALVFLEVPDFDAVVRWRTEQERKLSLAATGTRIMSPDELRGFVQHYERLSRHALRRLGETADVVLELAATHAVKAVRWNDVSATD